MIGPFTPFPDCSDHGALERYNGTSAADDYAFCIQISRKIVSSRVYFALLLVNAIFILVTTVMFIHFTRTADPHYTRLDMANIPPAESRRQLSSDWQLYALRKHSIFGAVVGALGYFIFSTCILVAETFLFQLTCEFFLWGTLVGFYSWIFALCARAYRLRHMIQINERKMQFMRRVSEERLGSGRTCPTLASNAEVEQLRPASPVMPAVIYVVSLIALILICFGVEYSTTQGWRQQCYYKWSVYLAISYIAVFFVAIVPFGLWYLRGYKDAHGIRTELIVNVGVGAVCFILFLTFSFAFPALNRNQLVWHLFASGNWLCIFMAIGHCMSIVVPLIKYAAHRRAHRILWGSNVGQTSPTSSRSSPVMHTTPPSMTMRRRNASTVPVEYTAESLDQVLSDPNMMTVLRQLSIQDFSSENVLFYEQYLNLVDKVRYHCQYYHHHHRHHRNRQRASHPTDENHLTVTDASSLSETSDAEKRCELLSMEVPSQLLPEFIDFYRVYIRENAPLQVNLCFRSRKPLDDFFQQYVEEEMPAPKKHKHPWALPMSTAVWRASTRPPTHPLSRPPSHSSAGSSLFQAPHSSKPHHEPSMTSVCSAATASTYERSVEESTPLESSVLTLAIFEGAREEAFWNIFAGVFPKFVQAYKP